MLQNFTFLDLEKRCLTGIIEWYSFPENSKLLFVEQNSLCREIFEDFFIQKKCSIVFLSLKEVVSLEIFNNYEAYFDYAISIETLEYSFDIIKVLSCLKKLLNENGKLLLGFNNRLGLNSFCGENDVHTKQLFNGIEAYKGYNYAFIKANGRSYSKYEICDILDSAGFYKRKFYSVFPNLQMPQLIYSENTLPNEDLSNRYFPLYRSPQTVFLNEQFIIDSLVKNNMFHQMANAYFVECCDSGSFSNVSSLTFSFDRGNTDALITKICDDSKVYKYPLNSIAKDKLVQLHNNMQNLKSKGIHVVDTDLKDGVLSMPFIDAPVATTYLKDLFLIDREKFIEQMDIFIAQIRKSSEKIGDGILGPVYKEGFVDLVPLNCFYKDGLFTFYDQEFCFENYPVNAIIYRAVCIVYCDINYRDVLPMSFFWNRYGISEEQIVEYEKLSCRFTDTLRNQKLLKDFNSNHKPSWDSVAENRSSINKSAFSKQLIDSCFDNLNGKEVYIFGSGKYADKFMSFYKKELNIKGVLDNNKGKWGSCFYDVPVMSPETLINLEEDAYKVIICIGQYLDIYNQLISLGTKNIGVFDPNYFYIGRKYLFNNKSPSRKYQVGYIAGVFDLFHVGHLNLLRRAKEQCEYLIVGVCEDDHVTEYKKKEVFVPLEDRLEIVRNCKYVDEAVVIPFKYGSSADAFRKYHFDVQFSGSDYENDSEWLAVRDFLRQHGSELIFFPYTEKTSSTKIKALIEKGLM